MDDEGATATRLLAGRYELGSMLGHGGMGDVRDATDQRLARRVAVKILRPDLAAQPRARRRFETEGRAAARLSHPNAVMVFDSGEDDGVPFIVMERLPGRTLADEFLDGPLMLERARAVASEILSALAAAHAAGIVHRDIKPGNVLLTEDGHAKVSDFGIAKTVDDIDQTQTTELIATPQYLAPERLAGQPASHRSDLYSVGVLLYEATSGRRPFEGDTPISVMVAIERGRAEPLTSPRSRLPAEFVAAIERAMSRDPDRRFESASEMAAALDATTDPDATVPVEVRLPPETVPFDVAARDGLTRALAVPKPRRARGRAARRARRALGLTVGAVLVAAAAFGAVHEYRQHERATPAPPAVGAPGDASNATNGKLPAPLEDAMRRLEESVAQ